MQLVLRPADSDLPLPHGRGSVRFRPGGTDPRRASRLYAGANFAKLALLMTAVALVQPVSAADFCVASAEARAVFEQLRIPPDASLDEATLRQEWLAILKKALEASPRDLFLHEKYQDVLADGFQSAQAISEYDALLSRNPGDPMYLYLAARAEYSHHTQRAIERLESALQKDPRFGPAHMLLADIRQTPAFRNEQQEADHLKAYEEICPKSLEARPRLRWSDNKAAIGQAAQRIRKALAGRVDGDALAAYARLWSLEGVLKPSDQLGPWKEQVKADLAAILKPEAKRDAVWYSTASQGADIVNDRQTMIMAMEEMAGRFPRSVYPLWVEGARWRAAHPYPSRATKEEEQAYWKAAWEHYRETSAKWPGTVSEADLAWRAGVFWEGTPKDELAGAAKALMAALERNPHAFQTSPPVEIETAEQMVHRDMLIEMVPPLVIRGFAVTEERFSPQQVSDLTVQTGGMSMKDAWYLFGYMPLAVAYIRLGRLADAKDSVSQIEDKLAKVRPKEGASAEEKFRHNEMEARFWDIKGQLAEKEGRKLDALVDYRTSLSLYPPRRPRPDERDEVMGRAQHLWKEMGGTERGWSDWATTASLRNFNAGSGGANAWKTLAAAKPGITMKDTLGKTWTPAELQDKITFVTLWATWCGPCRAELPYFAKLYQQYKDRKDVAIFAFNVDDDPKAMDSYLEKNGLQLPSIAARDFAYEFLPVMAIPSNWLITPQKSEMLWGDYDTGEKWMEAIAKAIQNVLPK